MAGRAASQPVIALDVGGTSIKSGCVTADGRVLGASLRTPIRSTGPAAEILHTLTKVVTHHVRALAGQPFQGVALGVPGPFDYEGGVSLIRGVHKYEAVYGVNLREALQAGLASPDLSVRFRNDAEAALVGEARYGAGRPFQRLLGLTLGTGLGSSFLAAGAPVKAAPGLPPNGELYAIPHRGALADDTFSIRGLTARLRALRPELRDVRAASLLARQNSPELQAGFQSFGDELGGFLRPFAEAFDAQAVLVLGGLANTFDLFGPALGRRLPMPVLTGQLGSEAALLGAAALFFAAD